MFFFFCCYIENIVEFNITAWANIIPSPYISVNIFVSSAKKSGLLKCKVELSEDSVSVNNNIPIETVREMYFCLHHFVKTVSLNSNHYF